MGSSVRWTATNTVAATTRTVRTLIETLLWQIFGLGWRSARSIPTVPHVAFRTTSQTAPRSFSRRGRHSRPLPLRRPRATSGVPGRWPHAMAAENRTGVGLAAMNTASPSTDESFSRRATCPGMGPKLNTTSSTLLAVRELAGRPGVIDGLRWRRRRSTQHPASTVASLMSTALLAVSRVRFRSLARDPQMCQRYRPVRVGSVRRGSGG